MNLNQIIKIIRKMHFTISELENENFNFSFELDIFEEETKKNLFAIKSLQNVNIIDIEDFIKMDNSKKIIYFFELLNRIEEILLKEVNEFMIKNEKNSDLIQDYEINIVSYALNKIRKRNTSSNLKNIIREIFRRIFSILDEKINSYNSKIMQFHKLKGLINKLYDYTNDNYRKIDTEIDILTKKLKELEYRNKNNENLLESEKLKKDKLIKELEFKNKLFQQQLEKENELEKINRAIDKLQVPSKELKESQNKFRENRDNFDKYAIDMFKIAIIIFVVMTLYLFFFTEMNDVSKSVSLGYYLTHSFPILFPTLLGFLFIRQSNINAKELDRINRRFILIHEVNQSLRALVEINNEKQMNEKTQKVIDKLIENILNYASDNSNIKNNQETNLFTLNESIDKLIDTIDKKLTVVGKSG